MNDFSDWSNFAQVVIMALTALLLFYVAIGERKHRRMSVMPRIMRYRSYDEDERKEYIYELCNGKHGDALIESLTMYYKGKAFNGLDDYKLKMFEIFGESNIKDLGYLVKGAFIPAGDNHIVISVKYKNSSEVKQIMEHIDVKLVYKSIYGQIAEYDTRRKNNKL